MKKDVIYIDIEDDITGIIGKVKDAKSKIVALVPPKRIGVLQSAVNLKLLQKSAHGVDKRVVLVTNDHSLTALAAGLKIPIAKNLQSKPEVPILDAPDTLDEEVIDGKDLPVGDLDDVAKKSANESAADDISSQVELRTTNLAPDAKASASTKPKAAGKIGKQLKVPNFASFRTRFFVFGGVAVILIAFLYWAFALAPHATITMSAKTTPVSIDQTLSLDPGLSESKPSELKFKPTTQQLKKSTSTDFTATGTKDIGTKATGTITITNSFDSDDKSLPSGTIFIAASGQHFASTAAVTIPGAKVSGGSIKAGKAAVQVQAADVGSSYNVSAQAYTVEGYASLSATGTEMTGGDKQTVTVVSQDDIDKAKTQLAQQDTNAVKVSLKKQFNGDFVIIDESFTADQGTPTSSPTVGEQAKQAKLTLETTYTIIGLARNDINNLLNSALKSALDTKPNQSIFSNGSSKLTFGNFQKFDGGAASVRASTTGYIGTKVDTKALARQLAGKRFGEIQAIVNQISNIDSSDIKISPSWVNSAPSDPAKIDIKFTISNDGS